MKTLCKSGKPSNILATYIFLVPLVYYIPSEFNKVFNLSKEENVLISVGVIVLLMSYIIMPIYTKVYSSLIKSIY